MAKWCMHRLTMVIMGLILIHANKCNFSTLVKVWCLIPPLTQHTIYSMKAKSEGPSVNTLCIDTRFFLPASCGI